MQPIAVTAELARLRTQIETCERLLLRVSDERICQGLRQMLVVKQAESERLMAQHRRSARESASR